MTPPPNYDAYCSGCFLHERTGRTCPMVRGGYDPEAAETRRRAAALHAAVLQDAQSSPTLAGLVHSDAAKPAGLPAAVRLGLLLPAPVDPLAHDSRKEVRYAAIPRRTAR
jgi:hypothetical protein